MSEVVTRYSMLGNISSVLMKLLINEYDCDVNARGHKVRFGQASTRVLVRSSILDKGVVCCSIH